METVREKTNKTFDVLKGSFGYKNKMQAPKLVKVVISTGTGSLKDKRKAEIIEDRLMKITGQKPVARSARQSIASFKVRQGDSVGYQVTVRGGRMQSFLNKLIHAALPRTKDFRGLNPGAIDDMGNFTIGIKEHTIFPEAADEDIKDVFGLAITVVTTATNKEEAKAFLEHLGFPFKKEGDAK